MTLNDLECTFKVTSFYSVYSFINGVHAVIL